jgi:hypothetical protein
MRTLPVPVSLVRAPGLTIVQSRSLAATAASLAIGAATRPGAGGEDHSVRALDRGGDLLDARDLKVTGDGRCSRPADVIRVTRISNQPDDAVAFGREQRRYLDVPGCSGLVDEDAPCGGVEVVGEEDVAASQSLVPGPA